MSARCMSVMCCRVVDGPPKVPSGEANCGKCKTPLWVSNAVVSLLDAAGLMPSYFCVDCIWPKR